ncbi:hypothetical protein P3X46_016492 [Hevea brasiliensis]|uniref:RING-type E3 ubiquitin transferase n=1 Tax=Hevea brasiliensis TaxID=3981 RepID=A0ABQ9LZE9_HEVBR|nr:RING-H2 finger protein ATL22 [Hevea brasiliensis]KAJ9173342.1 hypothetical protein P3X46_016492 [Hevea brasiliensis]
MDSAFLFILFFSSMFLSIQAFQANCLILKCGDGAPDIRFPFRLSGRQPHHCGRPAFELSCKDNTTMIRFPSYGELVVKSISYDVRKLHLLDPKNCVHQVFLNLNLSHTPFRYYYVIKNYTYLNCSTRLPPSFSEVTCLSDSRHHVYTVESSLVLPESCRPVKTVAIPFSYSPYLADNSFGLGLTWSSPGSDEDCEAKGGQCKLQTGYSTTKPEKGFPIKYLNLGDISSKFLMVLLCILAVVLLISIKMYHSKKVDMQLENENLLEVLRCYKAQENM